MRHATAIAALVVGFSLASSATAAADDNTESPRKKTGRGSYKLFDHDTTVKAFVLDIGPIWHRKIQDETPAQHRLGFERGAPLAGEVAVGMTFTTPTGPFVLIGAQRTILRVIDDKSFSWSLFHQDVGGGLRLGPFEPEARFGISLLTADIFHGEPSVQMLTPRVTAGFGLHLGQIRVDIKAHSEYLWRWFGSDYPTRGITIGLRLDTPRPKSPFAESFQ
jgi:hypothetical protein